MSYEVEKSIIGCILFDNNTMGSCMGLRSEMFSSQVLGMIFDKAKEKYSNGEPIDPVTIRQEITESDIQKEYVDEAIASSINSAYLSTNIRDYVKALEKKSRISDLNDFFRKTKITANNLDEVTAKMRYFAEDTEASDDGITTSEMISRYKDKRFKEGRDQGISIGYPKVDSILTGIDGGDVCIIAARPGVGKSALTTEISLNIAKTGKRVVMFNLEMSDEQIYDRMVAHESGLELSRVRRATKITDREYELFEQGNEELEKLKNNLKVFVDKYTISEMEPYMRKADVVIIDYAQLIKAESRYKGNRYAEVGETSRRIKMTAKRLNVPIILLAQLNRKSDETSEPSMSELRETGDFEQDASQIILLWNLDEDGKRKGVKVDKNRQGKTGKTELAFDGNTMSFTDPEHIPFD